MNYVAVVLLYISLNILLYVLATFNKESVPKADNVIFARDGDNERFEILSNILLTTEKIEQNLIIKILMLWGLPQNFKGSSVVCFVICKYL